MDKTAYSHPDAAGLLQVKPAQTKKRRFQLRTVLVPLLFLLLHWIVLNLTALVYVVVFILATSAGQSLDPLVIMGDMAKLQQILMEQFPVITVIYAALLIPVYAIYLKRRYKTDSSLMRLFPPRISHLLLSLVVMVGALGVTNLWFGLLDSLSKTIPLIRNLMDNYLELSGAFTPNVGYFWLVLGISIMAPVVEELLFRGIIQGELHRSLPAWLAITLQAILFALFHMEPIQSSYVLLPGLLLGLAYYWSRSLWVPILMHVAFNFIGSVLPALFKGNDALGQGLLWTEVAFIALGIAAMVFFARYRRKGQTMLPPDSHNMGNGA